MLSLAQLRVHIDGTNGTSVERFEGTSLEKLCHINDTKRITKIRLIRTKLKHRLFIADHRIRSFGHFVSLRREFFKCGGQHFFPNFEYVFLGRKAHLKV